MKLPERHGDTEKTLRMGTPAGASALSSRSFEFEITEVMEATEHGGGLEFSGELSAPSRACGAIRGDKLKHVLHSGCRTCFSLSSGSMVSAAGASEMLIPES